MNAFKLEKENDKSSKEFTAMIDELLVAKTKIKDDLLKQRESSKTLRELLTRNQGSFDELNEKY